MLPEMEKWTTVFVDGWLLPILCQVLPRYLRLVSTHPAPRSDLATLSWRGHCWLRSLSKKSMVQV
jgi:hypothetical protein